MLDFACRHHVIEWTIGAAFCDLFGKSTDPNLPVFEIPQNSWKEIDKGKCSYLRIQLIVFALMVILTLLNVLQGTIGQQRLLVS